MEEKQMKVKTTAENRKDVVKAMEDVYKRQGVCRPYIEELF